MEECSLDLIFLLGTARPFGPLDGDVNWMSPLQGRSPLVQVKEPNGNLDMVNYL